MDKITRLPEWKNLYDTFKDRDYNDLIMYEELNNILVEGDIRKEKRHIIDKFRKELLRQNNKALENVPKKGYRIVNANEHVRLSSREIKRAERRARQAVEFILYTEDEQLTDREKAVRNMAAARVQPILASLIGEQKALKEEQKFKLPNMPRR